MATQRLTFPCPRCASGEPIERAAVPILIEHYPEPANGTRAEAIKGLLKEGYRSPERAKVNTRATSATGLQLGDKFVSILDVLRLATCPPLHPTQVRIVELYFGADLTNAEVGHRLGYSTSTVVRLKYAAIAMIEHYLWPFPVDTPPISPSTHTPTLSPLSR